jgi:hypothetical protein
MFFQYFNDRLQSHFLPSILKKGLVLNPLHAQTTGRAFGDGVYFADVFDKSLAYSDADSGGSRYMLLCDVDLGVCKKYEKYSCWSDEVGRTEKEEDSIWIFGNHRPDPTKVLLPTVVLWLQVGLCKNQIYIRQILM